MHFKRISLMALVLCLLLLSACEGLIQPPSPTATSPNPSATVPPAPEQVEITWVVPMPFVAQGELTTVLDRFNQQLSARIPGMSVKLMPLPEEGYAENLQQLMDSGTSFDIAWADLSDGKYEQLIEKQQAKPLQDLLEANAPQLYAARPQWMWDYMKSNNQIYAIPANKLYAGQTRVAVRQDVATAAETTGFKSSSLPNPNTTVLPSDFFNALKPVAAQALQMFPTSSPMQGIDPGSLIGFQYEEVFLRVVVDKSAQGGKKALNWYGTDQFEKWVPFVRDWYSAHYYPATVMTGTVQTEAASASLFLLADNGSDDTTVKQQLKTQYGQDYAIFGATPGYINEKSLLASVNFLSPQSAHPEKALQLMELLNNDAPLLNLLSVGIAGDQFTLDDKGFAWRKVNNGKPLYYVKPEVLGTIATSLVLMGDPIRETFQEQNEKAARSSLKGFVFDPTPVAAKVEACQKVINEYEPRLVYGVYNNFDALYKTFKDKLAAAGYNDIVAEVQKQLNAVYGPPA